ncbi:hypothetical protein RUM43_008279 [Polyplax serrata]|uniref:Uncharacterized protein n=1 Tax=Polyplax serrata TaxID=468196 RepID=A0AAN8PNV1_POLSC
MATNVAFAKMLVICISCCDEDYCNRKVPTQTSNATFKNSRTLRQKPTKSQAGKTAETNSIGEEASGAEKLHGIRLPHLINAIFCHILHVEVRDEERVKQVKKGEEEEEEEEDKADEK